MLKLEKTGPGSFGLSGSATIGQAVRLKDLLSRIAGDSDLELDLSGLSDLDAAGAQVLLAFRRSRPSPSTRLIKCPEAIRENLRLLGLEADLLGA